MHRYIIRFFVAMLTFIIGVTLSAAPSLFNIAATDGTYAACDHRTIGVVTSPTMSIETQSGEPLKLLYSSTDVDTADTNKRHVHFVVENVSNKDIKAYTITCSKLRSGMKGGGIAVVVETNSLKEIFRTGEMHPLTIDCDDADTLSLSVNSAEFADGSHWNNGSH